MSKKRKSLGQIMHEISSEDKLYKKLFSGRTIAPWSMTKKEIRDSFNRIARKFKRAIEKGWK